MQDNSLGYCTEIVILSVIPVAILRLVYIVESNDSADPTYDYFNRVLATEIATTFSIIVACISFIRPFLDSIETGLLASKLRNASVSGSQGRSRSTKLQYVKDVFKFRGAAPEERQPPLVGGAQKFSGFPESYELSHTSEAQAWAEPVPQSQENSNDDISPNNMYITRARDVAVTRTDPLPGI